MKTFKRALSVLLVTVMLLTAAPLSGFVGLEWPELNLPEWNLPDFDFNLSADAAEIVNSGSCGENLTWTLDSDGVLTIAGTGEMENYDYLDNDSPWQSNCSAIKTVIIENGVTSIGDYAFWFCNSLTSVTIPDSVTSIGGWTFAYCSSLTSVTIGNSVTSIGYAAFSWCTSLTSITIGNSVTSIGYAAFYNCTSLTLVTIGDSVTSIGDEAFRDCTSLTSVTIGDSVMSIGDYAFSECTSLTTVTIPDSVTSIGDDAFGECTSLTSVTIGDSVTSIGGAAFGECTSLTSVTIGDSVTSIGNSAFYNCDSLTSVTIPDSVTSIGWYAFSGCTSLTSVTIGDSVKNIGGSAFCDCTSLTSVTIPDSVTSIGEHAFFDCTSLTSVTIGDSVTSIGYAAFYDCTKLTSVTIPDSVTSIGAFAFYDCTSLTSVTIGNSVTSIGWYAFYNCTSLTSVTIPDSVTSIEDSAFYYCTSLTAITVNSDNTTYCSEDGVLFNKSKTELIQYPIGNARMSYTIPDSVTSIGNFAFSYCTSLTSVTIGDSVTSIGNSAFYYCTSLTLVTIGNSVTSIGDGAFFYCTSLTDITVDADNTIYCSEDGVLFNKSKTELIQYPIGNARTSYTIPDSVTSIGDYAFYNCTKLTTVTIPDSVTSIGEYAFYNCTKLTSVTIPDSVTSIGEYAFYECTSLKDVYYSGTEEQWAKISIGSDNTPLTNATIHYNSSGIPSMPTTSSTTYNGVTATIDSSYFKNDSKKYNHDLAKFCSLFTVIGYTKNKSTITEHLSDCGFAASDKYIEVNAKRDEVNYFIANKPITVNGQTKTLVFVACIGSHKDQWYSNFDPLSRKSIKDYADRDEMAHTHHGFANAREYVYDKLEDYVIENKIDVSNSVVLLTGHSRGAATVNLLAAKLIDTAASIGLNANNVYAYGFATPNTTLTINGTSFNKYKSIINIVNPEDLVTKLLPVAWGYGRYGVTYTLPSATSSTKSYYNSLKTNMQKEYALLLDGATYHPYPGGEKQTYNVVLSLSNSVSDINQLYEQKFWWNNDKVSVQQFITQTLCKYMATSDKKEKASVETALAEICLFPMNSDEVIFDLAYYFVMYQGILGSFFEEAHQAETYCAYIMSMTSAQVTTKRDAYKGTVNCPVDVEIYDTTTGELVGRIVDNVVDEEVAAGENAIIVSVDGDSKEFWLPSDGDYEIRLIGNDTGTMDYTLSEIDSDIGEVKRVNFFDVAITDGLTMTADVESEEFVIEEHELVMEDNTVLKPTEILNGEEITSYSIEITATEGGFAGSSRTANSGDYVSLSATADEGWQFVGWFENGELLTNEPEFAFVAKSDRKLTAKFEHIDHDFSDWSEVIPADCENAGSEQRVCEICDAVETQEIAAIGHAEEIIPAVAATCTQTGLTEGKKCSVCGEILVAQTETEKLAHEIVIVGEKEATDTQNGYTGDVVCDVCGEVIVLGDIVFVHSLQNVALGKDVVFSSHDNVQHNNAYLTDGEKADKIWDGGTENAYFIVDLDGLYKISSLAVFIKNRNINTSDFVVEYSPDNEHYEKAEFKRTDSDYYLQFELDQAVDARYVKVTIHCDDALQNLLLSEVEVYGEKSANSRTYPSKNTLTYNFNITDFSYGIVHNPDLSDWLYDSDYFALYLYSGDECVYTGEKRGDIKLNYYITGVKISAQVYEPLFKGDSIVSFELTGKTDTKDYGILFSAEKYRFEGSFDETYYYVKHIPLTDYNLAGSTCEDHVNESEFISPTCTIPGQNKNTCLICGAVTFEQTDVPALGHTEEIISAIAATCTETGLTEGKKCSVCGEVLVAQAVIDKTSHKPTMVGEKAATATQDGYTGDTVCATCGMMIEEGKVIPATGDSSGSGRCDHLCHKDGILGFFWKILRLFFKLFQINPVCECGAAHY